MKTLIFSLALSFLFVGGVALACDSDIDALNYNPAVPDAVVACIPKVYGCTNPDSWNYNSSANTDNGKCVKKTYGADPKLAHQPLWGMNGYDIERSFVSLKLGEKITYKLPVWHGTKFMGNVGADFTDVCPSWYPSPVLGLSACWTTIRR